MATRIRHMIRAVPITPILLPENLLRMTTHGDLCFLFITLFAAISFTQALLIYRHLGPVDQHRHT